MTTKRFFKFSAVGSVNALLDFGIFSVLLYLFSVPVIFAHMVGFLVAVLNSYFMNKFWTFEGSDGHNSRVFEFTLFMITVISGLGLSTLFIWLIIPYMHPLLAKVATSIFCFIWNFIFSYYFVFKPD